MRQPRFWAASRMTCPSQQGSITAASRVSESATRYAFVWAGPNVKETISSIAHLLRRKLIGDKNGDQDQPNRQGINNHGVTFEENTCQRRRENKNNRADRFHNPVGNAHLRIMDKLTRLRHRHRTSRSKASQQKIAESKDG